MKELYKQLLSNIYEHIVQYNPELLRIVVFDEEVYQPHMEMLFTMLIDCLTLEDIGIDD